MTQYLDNIKKNFGFGCMRLPMNGDKVDYDEFTKMVDEFLARGFNYFDTAHVYIGGQSETAIRDCISKRHKREDFILTNKLSGGCFHKQEDIRPFLNMQLEACGVDYFDFYLMHAQNADNFKFYKQCRAYETAFELKSEGKIKHVGISFHDKASVLDQILTEYPELEVVQIQFNYLDYEDAGVESRKCYEVCRKHNKPIIVMEPVKGGSLVNIPAEAKKIYNKLGSMTPASYALRFAAGFDGIMMVLSGMSNMPQMLDNVSFMEDFKPLSKEELIAVNQVREIIQNKNLIPCTGCRYCTDNCPKHILIPDLFADMNALKAFHDWNSTMYYEAHTTDNGLASDCAKCGLCEKSCPQHLHIRDLLVEVADSFEKRR